MWYNTDLTVREGEKEAGEDGVSENRIIPYAFGRTAITRKKLQLIQKNIYFCILLQLYASC